jgi:hypothetical protein
MAFTVNWAELSKEDSLLFVCSFPHLDSCLLYNYSRFD